MYTCIEIYNIIIYVHLLLFFFYFEHDFRINIEKLLSYLRAYIIRCTHTIISHDEYKYIQTTAKE